VSLGDEINGNAAVGTLLEQEIGSAEVWNANAAHCDEDRMVVEAGEADCLLTAAGHAFLLEEDDLLFEEDGLLHEEDNGLLQEARLGRSGQRGDLFNRIDLDDPSSFPPLHGSQVRASPLRAEIVTGMQPFSTHAEAGAIARSSQSGDDKTQGTVRQDAGGQVAK